MASNILLSSAYLPPVEYFSHIIHTEEALIEREENYLKQSYRNRCYILSASGPQLLTVPVYLGSIHKTPVREIRIDYSKRWQQVHLRALTASYKSSPYFIHYYENIEKIILSNYEFLLDLNMDLLKAVLKMINIEANISYTTDFMPVGISESDFRYSINPKKESGYIAKKYMQVFTNGKVFVPGLSIVDLIFNIGRDALHYL
ncbi:MAG: WbqC family protein [Bacteroidia bacterium]|nr:WbqC family protein [Bacteroidia bacterium]